MVDTYDCLDVSSSYLKTEAQTWVSRSGRPTKRAKRDGEEDVTGVDDEEESRSDDDKEPASRRLVIHVGSDFIRVGRATDLYPTAVPNVLARKLTTRDEEAREAGSGPDDGRQSMSDPPREHATDAQLDMLRAELRSIMRQYKLRPVSNGWQSANSYNASVEPERVAEHNDVYHVGFLDDVPEQVVVGQEALRLAALSKDDNTSWCLYRPWNRGMLDVAGYARTYGDACVEALLGDLQQILTHAISAPPASEAGPSAMSPGLGIPESSFGTYSVLLLVPDSFSRSDLRALGHVFLRYMGFSALHVQTEGLCATFGAGLSAACVVDIGATSIGISCVEEGLVLPETRVALSYGGRDMSRFFGDVLRGSSFPYKDLNAEKRLADAALLADLKERLVTLQPSQVSLNLYDFMVRLPGHTASKYALRVYDEPILAGLMLFHPSVAYPPPMPRRPLTYAPPETNPTDEPEPSTALAAAANASLGGDEATELSVASVLDLAPTLAMFGCLATRLSESVAVLVDMNGVRPPATPTTSTFANGDATVPLNQDAPEGATESSHAAGATGPGMPATTPSSSTTQASASASGRSSSSTNAKAAAAAVPQTSAMATQAAKCATAASQAASEGMDVVQASSLTPLDHAVFRSLLASTGTADGVLANGGEERLRRLANNIVCTGGAAHISGLSEALEARVSMLLAEHYTPSDPSRKPAVPVGPNFTAPQATVIPPPRNLDPASLAWKGLAVLANLDTMQELWVQASDWDTFGYRALKEKSLFL